MVTCALMDIRTSQAIYRITLCSSHSGLTDPNSFVLWKNLGSGAIRPYGSGADWLLTTGLFSGQRR